MSSGTSSSRWRFDVLDMEYLMDLHLALFSDASSMSARIRLGPSVGKAGSWGGLVVAMVWIHAWIASGCITKELKVLAQVLIVDADYCVAIAGKVDGTIVVVAPDDEQGEADL